MRILIAHANYRVGGGEDRYARQQFDLLRPDHEVELLAVSNEALASGIPTATRMTFSPRVMRSVEDRITQFRPDLIHVHNVYPALGPAVHLGAERRHVPLVQTVHNFRLRCPNGLMFTQGELCRRCESGNYANALVHSCFQTRSQAAAYAGVLWVHRFLMRLETKVSAFIAPSIFMRNRLLAWGIPERRVWTIRNFVASIHPSSSKPGAYGAYIGRLAGEKGLGVLLEALSLANDPPFRVVGDGPLSSDLIELSARLRLKNTVFTGRLEASAVGDVLAESRFLVMPSLWEENAPLAVLESMAAGRPVLVSRTGGLPELIEGGSGMIFEPGDPRSLAEKIRILSVDDELCERLGSRARVFAQEHLSAEGHLRQLESVYRFVAGGMAGHSQLT